MATDGREARQALWARYDAGELSAPELDARLKAVDRAADDPAALERAVSGTVRVRTGGRRRSLAVAGGLAATAVLAAGGVALVRDDAGGEAARGRGPGAGAGPNFTVVGPPVVVGPAADCAELDDFLERFEAIDEEAPAANPAVLSEPPAVPEGYALGDQDELLAGTDPDVAMSVSAGDPAPELTMARTLVGPLAVTMRAWVYESADAAGAAGERVLREGVCTYDIQAYDVPDRPEIFGSWVTGVIPTTAFAGWRLGERRFSVAVQAGADGDAEALAAAQQLAGAIAALELDAARTPPAPG